MEATDVLLVGDQVRDLVQMMSMWMVVVVSEPGRKKNDKPFNYQSQLCIEHNMD